MSYIVATDLILGFGGQVILDRATFSVEEQDRVGLIGPNGSGKSTLLKILHGDLTPDEGRLTRAKRLRIGYLPQDITELRGESLLNSVLASVPGRSDLEIRLTEVEAALERAEESDAQIALSQTLADVHEELAHFEDQFSPHQAMRILRGLGFRESDDARPLPEFSGGWKMRAALAGLLFQQPDVLLLDEPTNHLDLPSVRWLNDFLAQYRHAMVLISHDRTFLNGQVNRVLSFEVEGLRSYPGNYDAYLVLREEEVRVLENRARNQEQKRKQMEQYIARFRVSARRSGQAQSRIKALTKMQEIVIPGRRKSLSFRFPSVERCGEVALKAEKIGKAFGDTVLYTDLDLTIMRGDRIGVVGVNGAGKTTLLRLLAGELKPDAGAVDRGHHVSLGYYAQHHADSLTPGNSVLNEVHYATREAGEQFARSVLGLFLFRGDAVEKPVSILSGGEKARVALARLFVQSHNVLLMDEPTNHLDLDSSEALAEALQTFGGTLVFVSHNLAFVNALATKIWDIADGTLTEYAGTLDQYLDHQRRRARPTPAATASAAPPVAETPAAKTPGTKRGKTGREGKARRRREAEARRTVNKRLQPLRRGVAELEGRIAELEERQREREDKLGRQEIYDNPVLFQSLLTEFNTDRENLERLLARWERKHAELEGLEQSPSATDS